MRLANPDRLVLDFSGARLKTSETEFASNLDPVREIRLAQFTPEVSRVVIDLRHACALQHQCFGNAVTVSSATESRRRLPSRAPRDQPGAVATKATSHQPRRSRSAVAVPAPLRSALSLTQTVRSLASSRWTADLRWRLGRAQSLPCIQQRTGRRKPARRQAASDISDQQHRLRRSSSTRRRCRRALRAAAGHYSGEPISVNLKDVDLRDFFRLIHEISGLNVVVDPCVKGNLTIVLDDVPWDQALDIVLKNNDLDKQLDGNVLRIATRNPEAEAEQNRDLAKAQAEAADVVTTTRVLSYAKAYRHGSHAEEVPLFAR